jgi:hypothetical protein
LFLGGWLQLVLGSCFQNGRRLLAIWFRGGGHARQLASEWQRLVASIHPI